jgi:hypothetical protein
VFPIRPGGIWGCDPECAKRRLRIVHELGLAQAGETFWSFTAFIAAGARFLKNLAQCQQPAKSSTNSTGKPYSIRIGRRGGMSQIWIVPSRCATSNSTPEGSKPNALPRSASFHGPRETRAATTWRRVRRWCWKDSARCRIPRWRFRRTAGRWRAWTAAGTPSICGTPRQVNEGGRWQSAAARCLAPAWRFHRMARRSRWATPRITSFIYVTRPPAASSAVSRAVKAACCRWPIPPTASAWPPVVATPPR